MKIGNFKFGTVRDERDRDVKRFSFPDIWCIEKTKGPDRLVIAPSSGHIDLMIELSRSLPEPFGILYVLAVPRGGSEAGRYQSATPVSRAAIEAFLISFRDFFENDARHHIWISSLPAGSTLVYDNHNVIYAYGELERLQAIVKSRGLGNGDVVFPVPHVHHYDPKFDSEELRVLSYGQWKRFPLEESDS